MLLYLIIVETRTTSGKAFNYPPPDVWGMFYEGNHPNSNNTITREHMQARCAEVLEILIEDHRESIPKTEKLTVKRKEWYNSDGQPQGRVAMIRSTTIRSTHFRVTWQVRALAG